MLTCDRSATYQSSLTKIRVIILACNLELYIIFHLFIMKTVVGEEAEGEVGRTSSHHVSVAQQLFPSCLCSAVLTIIHLLDDPAVTPDGIAVYEAAQQVLMCHIFIDLLQK